MPGYAANIEIIDECGQATLTDSICGLDFQRIIKGFQTRIPAAVENNKEVVLKVVIYEFFRYIICFGEHDAI